jgi:UPF0755 protein
VIRRHPFRTLAAIVVVLIGVGAIAVGLIAKHELAPEQSNQRQQVVVAVEPHESLSTLVAALRDDRLIRSSLVFELYARANGLDNHIHPGKFVLDRGMGASELVAVLEAKAAVLPIKVTIPDGLRAQQEAAVLAGYGLFSKASYLSQVDGGNFAGIPPLPGASSNASWEGLAFGDTFVVRPSISAHQFLQLQLEDFAHKERTAIIAGAAKVGLNPYQVVVLASIVEAEATTAKDRGLVAGVFFNRLKQGMPLQSDVTIIYAMSVAGMGNTKFSTSFASPYNTYLHAGLPPGPIDSPGAVSLNAVLHPTSSRYLYFVSLKNGTMLFATTAAQHQQQVQEAGIG